MHYTIHYFNVPYIYSFTWALENVFHWFSSLKLSYLYKVPLLTLTPHPLNLLPTDTMSSKSPSLPCLNFFLFLFVYLFLFEKSLRLSRIIRVIMMVGMEMEKMPFSRISLQSGIHAWYCTPGQRLVPEEVLSLLGEFNIVFN